MSMTMTSVAKLLLLSQRLTLALVVLLFLTMAQPLQADSDLQETLAVSKFELLEDLPWQTRQWLGEGAYGNNETLATMSYEAVVASMDDESNETDISTSQTHKGQVSGFCLPRTATASSAACINGGSPCTADKACCSKQCVICTAACKGRCGLSKPRSIDDIQIFYYPWYASAPVDGYWRHWAIDARPDGGVYDPTHQDLPCNYFPRLGPYSSSSTEIMKMHMRWMARAGIGTVVVSWWGQGSYEDKLMRDILNVADDFRLKVAFYVESYGGGYVRKDSKGKTIGSRTPLTAMKDVMYLTDTYGCHRAIYRREGRPVFMFFAARSYKDGDQREWKQVWDTLHANPNYNPFVVAHDTNLDTRIIAGGWDGGHDYGTRAAYTRSVDWRAMASKYAAAGKTLYFTVSPGYDKTRLRNNKDAIIDRQDGALYKSFWMRAIAAKKNNNPVMITTFNEWHEGTQIEPAKPVSFKPYTYLGTTRDGFTYQDYEGSWGLSGEAGQFSYIDYTRKYAALYRNA